VKDNQPTLHAEIRSYFETAPSDKRERAQTVEKGRGRLEIRNLTVSHEVDWTTPERSYPGQFRFPKLATIAMVESRTERGDKIETERRSYISSRALSAAAFAAVRSHWAIENKLHQRGAPKIWLSCATLPSIWSAKPAISDPSSDAANVPHTIRNTCSKSSARCVVNLDSLPWGAAKHGSLSSASVSSSTLVPRSWPITASKSVTIA
jgi:hypothetical protein